ncbi:peptidylprolyl isomerase [Chromatium okenii]|uniref:peptidylprolyl isomerase n=1 Tax=Chromatium okenii TaxID=61644 RepID=UPI001F5BC516|nr:peptidylprolyl isomerase [Chromatium okenii]
MKAQSGRVEFKARHILVKDEDEAKKLIKQLDKGADFAELAKKNSTGPTGKDGGDLGWFDPKQMVPAFATAIADMKPGTYSKTPCKPSLAGTSSICRTRVKPSHQRLRMPSRS